MTENPFFEAWDTPFGLPPFERIRPEHFPPAFDRAMEEQAAEIAAIAGSAAAPSFANTIEALERSGRLLAGSAGCSTTSIRATPTRRSKRSPATTRQSSPRTRCGSRSTPVCSRGSPTSMPDGKRSGWPPDQLRLLERHHLRLVRSGRIARCRAEGADGGDLRAAGEPAHPVRPECAARRARMAAGARRGGTRRACPISPAPPRRRPPRERGLDGRYVITLARSSVEPFLAFSSRRDLRRTVWEAWAARGTHAGRARQCAADSRDHGAARRAGAAPRLRQLCRLPARRYDGQTPAAAERLLLQVWEPAKAKAAPSGRSSRRWRVAEGVNEPIAPWDWRYYAEKVRQRNTSSMKPS